MNQFFAEGAEFSWIETLFTRKHFSRDGQGLGDDGYLWQTSGDHVYVISTDTSVENIHFDLQWVKPEMALEKALLSNLSDINAMGGKTEKVFLNLCIKKTWDLNQAKIMGETLQCMEEDQGFRICGGDTVRAEGNCFFAFTVIGMIKGNALLRSNAKPGDKIYVSGCLGGSAAGLTLLQKGQKLGTEKSLEPLLRAHVQPQPPLGLGPKLAEFERVAAMDISDGLSSELWHLSKQSQCAFKIDWEKIPMHSALPLVGDAQQIRDWVLHGGEEYQLLFTGKFSATELDQLQVFSLITEIGEVRAGEGVYICEPNGDEELLNAKGWVH